MTIRFGARGSTAGGDEIVLTLESAHWDLWNDQIVYIADEAGAGVRTFDLNTREERTLATFDPSMGMEIGVSVTVDGETVFVSMSDSAEAEVDLVLVENFY